MGNKKKLWGIFQELLKEWEMSESTVINDRSVSPEDEYEQLKKDINEYKQRFLEALEDE